MASAALASLDRMSLVQSMKKKYTPSSPEKGSRPTIKQLVTPLALPKTDLPKYGTKSSAVSDNDASARMTIEANYTSAHFFGAQRKDSIAEIEKGRKPAPWEIEGQHWHAHMDDITFLMPLHRCAKSLE
jgi:hypothetical protein